MNYTQKNINWINATKALSIIGVYFVHCQLSINCTLDNLNCFVYPWYVNAFFFVSGYLLFWKQLSQPRIDEDRRTYIVAGGGKTLIFNILYRIVIPSIIFSAIEFFPSSIIQGREMSIGYALFKTIGGGTYWFTSALVVAELVLLLLFCSRKRNVWYYSITCLVFGLTSLMVVKYGLLNNNIWMWRHGLIALIFLALGGLYWQYEKQIDKLIHWWFVIPLMGSFIAIIVFCENTNPLVSTLQIQPLGFLTSAVSCLLLVWLCKRIPELKMLAFIGRNSLGFYFLSGALPIPLGLVLNKLIATLGLQFTFLQSLFVLLAVWFVCMALAYWIVIIINRWLPWLWDLRKLNKD